MVFQTNAFASTTLKNGAAPDDGRRLPAPAAHLGSPEVFAPPLLHHPFFLRFYAGHGVYLLNRS
jgi:hypothetical protein